MSIKLNEIKVGESFSILDLSTELSNELMRLGLTKGMILHCLAKIPMGPTVIGRETYEIAIGENFAKQISVERVRAS